MRAARMRTSSPRALAVTSANSSTGFASAVRTLPLHAARPFASFSCRPLGRPSRSGPRRGLPLWKPLRHS
jgi:hypothetical protein